MSEEAPPVIVETPPGKEEDEESFQGEQVHLRKQSCAVSKADVTSTQPKPTKQLTQRSSQFELQPARGSATVTWGGGRPNHSQWLGRRGVRVRQHLSTQLLSQMTPAL